MDNVYAEEKLELNTLQKYSHRNGIAFRWLLLFHSFGSAAAPRAIRIAFRWERRQRSDGLRILVATLRRVVVRLLGTALGIVHAQLHALCRLSHLCLGREDDFRGL